MPPPPMPSSRIDSTRLPLRIASETCMRDACACFAALAKASDATKYAATSIGSERRRVRPNVKINGGVVRAAGERCARPGRDRP